MPARLSGPDATGRTTAEIAARPEIYRRFDPGKDDVETWEDGAHAVGRAGTYEWWYFNAHLDDGAKLVVVFMAQDLSAQKRPLDPLIAISPDLPDGRPFEHIRTNSPDTYEMATTAADMRIGDNRFAGDLATYRITGAIEDVKIDVSLKSEIDAWRPKTGHMVFGPARDLEFAWLPPVPQGRVSGSYETHGKSFSAAGIGYHDHNWGTIGMMEIIHDWYWAHGQAGPYSVTTSYITSHEDYAFAPIPIFRLAKDGVVIADDATHVTFETLGDHTDARTGKPISNITRYTYDDTDVRYVVTYTRHRDLSVSKFSDEIGWPKKLAARLVRFDGAYLRFTGELRIESFVDGILSEEFSDDAIWELVHFGHARA